MTFAIATLPAIASSTWQRQQTDLRLEWYVVLLIVIEVLLSLYDLFIRPR